MKKKTIKRNELSNIRMAAGNEKRISKVICDGHVKEWVGIGWIDLGLPTKQQERCLTHVKD